MSFEQPNGPLIQQDGMPTNPFGYWLSRIHSICNANQQSGPTAQRPTKLLWLGRRYWDTDLQIPVYLADVNPPVWKDSMGAVV